MVNYQNGKIYILECLTTGAIYYGSTTQKLSKRKAQHTLHYRAYKNGKHQYMTSFEVVKGDNFRCYLVEVYPCDTKEELCKREGYYIRNNECVNKYIAGRTVKEYYKDNKDKFKEYYKDNIDKLKEYNKEYYKDNKDKIKEYYKDNIDKLKEYNKEYYKENIDKIKEYNKEYYKDNTDKIKEYYKKTGSVKITCDCGRQIVKQNLNRHRKTKIHTKLLNN